MPRPQGINVLFDGQKRPAVLAVDLVQQGCLAHAPVALEGDHVANGQGGRHALEGAALSGSEMFCHSEALAGRASLSEEKATLFTKDTPPDPRFADFGGGGSG